MVQISRLTLPASVPCCDLVGVRIRRRVMTFFRCCNTPQKRKRKGRKGKKKKKKKKEKQKKEKEKEEENRRKKGKKERLGERGSAKF